MTKQKTQENPDYMARIRAKYGEGEYVLHSSGLRIYIRKNPPPLTPEDMDPLFRFYNFTKELGLQK